MMVLSPPPSPSPGPSRLADRKSMRNSHIFQPPKTPASPMNATTIPAQGEFFSTASRKRNRADSSQAPSQAFTFRSQFQEASALGWAQYAAPDDSMLASSYEQGCNFVNERYRLAGGFDTPSQQPSNSLDRFNFNADCYAKRSRDQDAPSIYFGDHIPLSGPLARERHGVRYSAASSPTDSPSSSWTGLAFNIVGRVFNFGSSMIRGFYAGGGKGYDLNNIDGTELSRTPLPASSRENEFLGDFEQDNPSFSPASASRPPNKRRQTDRDTWILVGSPDTEAATRSPKRKAQGFETPRASLNATATAAATSVRPSASRASSRRNMTSSLHRHQSSFASTATGSPTQRGASATSHAFQRRASLASSRLSLNRSRVLDAGGLCSANNAPDSEMERYARKQARDERNNHRAMNHMSRQMEELIRQAQEALGTKYSVEGDAGYGLEDEGFVDDE